MKHMWEGPPEKPPYSTGDEPDLEFSIARSKALAPLLIMFGVTVLVIFVVILRSTPILGPVGAVADRAYGPADFPTVFAHDEALVGIAGGGGRGSDLVFPVPAPPFTEGIFPCSQCHAAIPPNPERRALTMHGEIEFTHDAEHRWCLDCHDLNNRDQLRLANGTLVPFTESYQLCGQCHGDKYRDWRNGIHGKRTGYWDGGKRYLLCVHCHNPHSPRFAALEPLPPPVRPEFARSEEDLAAGPEHGEARIQSGEGG